MDSSFNQENKHGIIKDDQQQVLHADDLDDSISLSSSDVSTTSTLSDFMEDATSWSSSSSLSDDHHQLGSSSNRCPLNDMSCLMQQLPIKRGLSKHYQGRSQSFTCLFDVRSVEDLVKPNYPYNKKLKTCKSYATGLFMNQSESINSHKHKANKISLSSSSKGSSSRGSYCSSSSSSTTFSHAKRNSSSSSFSCISSNSSLFSNRPPIPTPQKD